MCLFSEENNTISRVNLAKNDSIWFSLSNKGKLKLHATVADQNITYPNDLGLVLSLLSIEKNHEMTTDWWLKITDRGG